MINTLYRESNTATIINRYLFIINLQHAEHHLELHLRVLLLCYALEQFIAGHRYDTLIGPISYHGVGFATTSLPIGKERAVVPLPGILKDTTTKVIKYTFLQRKVLHSLKMTTPWFKLLIVIPRDP